MAFLCLPDAGPGFESGISRLTVGWGLGAYMKFKAEFCVFIFFFWAEVLMKAVDSQKICEQQIVKPWFLVVAKYTIVPVCFSTHLTLQELLGSIFDGVTATPSPASPI